MLLPACENSERCVVRFAVLDAGAADVLRVVRVQYARLRLGGCDACVVELGPRHAFAASVA